MRIGSSLTAVSWIPRDMAAEIPRLPWDLGVTYHDRPPPDTLDDVRRWLARGRGRFAHELRAWIDVRDGVVAGYGSAGRGYVATRPHPPRDVSVYFPDVALPDLRPAPDAHPDRVRFAQTAGGRAGVPAPRPPGDPGCVRLAAPFVWSTLSLTLRADGSRHLALDACSPIGCHAVYDHTGDLVATAGPTHGRTGPSRAAAPPWGDEDSPVVLAAVRAALEREVPPPGGTTGALPGGTTGPPPGGAARPPVRRLDAGEPLGGLTGPGERLVLVLDGRLAVEVHAQRLAEVAAGAVVDVAALRRGGGRTAVLRAVAPCRVSVAVRA